MLAGESFILHYFVMNYSHSLFTFPLGVDDGLWSVIVAPPGHIFTIVRVQTERQTEGNIDIGSDHIANSDKRIVVLSSNEK